jgi:transposase-like protein
MREEYSMAKQKSGRRERRKFTAAFKADVVKLCRTGSESIATVSRRLDLNDKSVRAWLRQADVDAGASPGEALTASERNELNRLRRDNKRLTIEREILKNRGLLREGG